jgi:hypothetical protein
MEITTIRTTSTSLAQCDTIHDVMLNLPDVRQTESKLIYSKKNMSLYL